MYLRAVLIFNISKGDELAKDKVGGQGTYWIATRPSMLPIAKP